jgi:hypothetical protein
MKLEYLPVPQFMHAVEEIELVSGLNLPVEQLLQDVVAEVAELYFPCSHAMHSSDPDMMRYLPGPQPNVGSSIVGALVGEGVDGVGAYVRESSTVGAGVSAVAVAVGELVGELVG